MKAIRLFSCLAALAVGSLVLAEDGAPFQVLFPKDGVPQGWKVGYWSDVSQPPKEPSIWEVKDGVLISGEHRSTWLMSEKEYQDFELTFEFKLGKRGNGGCALRAPMKGDPAFDGMELQMADFRYNPEAKDSELTGGLYRALAPKKQVYKPEEWNRYHITLRGMHIKVVLNDEVIHDNDLSKEDKEVLRHDNTPASALKDRPKRGHIGFQDLSRDGDRVMIRNAKIRELSPQ